MVRNAFDVPGLKILNSDNSVQSSAGSAKKSPSKKGNVTSSSSSSNSLK